MADGLELEELELEEPHAPTFSPITALPSTVSSLGQASSQDLEQTLPHPPPTSLPSPESIIRSITLHEIVHH